MFHQKQKGNYCRCHAINNLFGHELVALGEFDNYCNEFDKKNGFARDSSRNAHLFYNNGGVNNIFGYIIKKKGIKIKMEHFDFYRTKKVKVNNNVIGYIIYNRSHTYCVKINNGEKWIIDSMKAHPKKIDSMKLFERRGIGIICVMRE